MCSLSLLVACGSSAAGEKAEALEYIQARYDIDVEVAEAHHQVFEMIEGAREADFYDPIWQEEALQAIDNVKMAMARAGNLEPPDCLRALHDYYSRDDQLLDESMTLLAEGLAFLDNDKIRRSDEVKAESGQGLAQQREEGWSECGLTAQDVSDLRLDFTPPPD